MIIMRLSFSQGFINLKYCKYLLPSYIKLPYAVADFSSAAFFMPISYIKLPTSHYPLNCYFW